MAGWDDFSFGSSKPKLDKTLPATAAENIQGPHVPKDKEYRQRAKGQLVTLVNGMEQDQRISEKALLKKAENLGEKFTTESFGAQLRSLKKPDNGGFCIKTVKEDNVLYYTLLGKHGAVAECSKCGFKPHQRFTPKDAVELYKSASSETVKKYCYEALKKWGLVSLIQSDQRENTE